MKDLSKRLAALEVEFAAIKKELKADQRPITERVTSYETACLELGIDPINEGCLPKDVEAYLKLRVIAEALNEEHKFTFEDGRCGFYPYFKIIHSGSVSYGAYAGFGNVVSNLGASATTTSHGAWLVFITRELAEYAGKTFIDIYQDYLVK